MPSEVFRSELNEDVVDPYSSLAGVDRATFYARADLVQVDRRPNGTVRLISTRRGEAIDGLFPEYLPVASLRLSARDAVDDSTLGQAIQQAFLLGE